MNLGEFFYAVKIIESQINLALNYKPHLNKYAQEEKIGLLALLELLTRELDRSSEKLTVEEFEHIESELDYLEKLTEKI